MVNNFNRYSAHLQMNQKLKNHYNRLLSNCNWLETYKEPGTGPHSSNLENLERGGNVNCKLY